MNTKIFIILMLLPTIINCSLSFWANYKHYNSVESAKNGIAPCIRLDLSNQNLNSIPREILELEDRCLGNFRADHNQISEFPEFMCTFFNTVNYMYFEYNQFSTIPDTRCPSKNPKKFYTLNSLSYRGNQIKELPENLDILAATHVDLSHNQIQFIPENIDWRPVMTMDLSFNKIKNLPKRFGKKTLTVLKVNNNKLESLPDSLGDTLIEIDEITGLEYHYSDYMRIFDVSHNKISTVSDSFLKNKNIKKLILIGNPLSNEEIEKVRKALPNTEVVF